MNILFLPGSDKQTLSLCSDLLAHAGVKAKVTSYEYSFWSTERESTAKEEVLLLPEGDFDVVVAKSSGCIVFAEALAQSAIKFKTAILLGAPLNDIERYGVTQKAIEALNSSNVYFVQQRNDRVCCSSQLEALGFTNVKTIDGNDHQYRDFDEYVGFLNQAIGI